jgi:hypothetical protein
MKKTMSMTCFAFYFGCFFLFWNTEGVAQVSTNLPFQAKEIIAKMDREIEEARSRAVVSLKTVLKNTVKSGDLKASVLINEQIQQISSCSSVARQNKWYIGNWKMIGIQSKNWNCVLRDGGIAELTNEKEISSGSWEEANGIIYVKMAWGTYKIYASEKNKKTYVLKNNKNENFTLEFKPE